MAWPESWLGLPGREFQSPHVSDAVTRTVLYCIAQTDGGTPHGMGEMGRRPTSGFPDVIVDHGYATAPVCLYVVCRQKAPALRLRKPPESAVLAHHPATRSRSCPSLRPFATNPQTHKTSFPHFTVLHSSRPPRKDRASVCPVSCSSSSHRSFFSFVFFSMHHASWIACSPQTMRRSVPAPVTHQVTDHCEFNPWRSACCAEIRTVIFPRCCRRGRRPPRELMARTAITDSYAEASPNG